MRTVAIVVLSIFVGASAFADEAIVPVDAIEPVDAAVAAPVELVPSYWHYTFGAGYEMRSRREVNPEYVNWSGAPQLFANVRRRAFAVQLEYTFDGETSSHAGSYGIATSTSTFGGWARLQFDPIRGYAIFTGLGGGAHFDRVRTTFRDASDERRGSRRFTGVGFGLNKTFLTNCFAEIEWRAISEEGTRGAVFAGAFRFGATF